MKNASLLAVFVLAFGCGSSQQAETAHTDPQPTEEQTSRTDTEPTASEPRIVVGTDPCATDADCVPDGCCHPAACVAQGHQPACDGVCTTDCRYGTLDCGGACLCQEGHCAARLSQPPVIPGTDDVQ
jgi:hypothetical protein